MLTERGILASDHARILLTALNGLDLQRLRAARFDGSSEDFFFFVESQLESRCGPEVAGRLHLARSRNDIDITLYRMVLRKEVLDLAVEVLALRSALLDHAERHLDTVMPAHTHTQPAQPTTLAHYLMAMIEVLERDTGRLRAAYVTTNRSPLGAGAITTTGFPIDRNRTAHLLGFDALQTNSYGAIAAVDYVLEAVSSSAAAMVSLGKFLQDLLLWSMREFGFLRLADGFVQGSSIMPQKRNPVALEHARILASRAFGEAQAVMTSLHNTPFGDIVDAEDDLQPLLMMVFGDSRRALRLVTSSMREACFDTGRMGVEAGLHFLTVTELADTLVREAGLSFREAHGLAGKAVRANSNDDTPARVVDDLLRLAPGIVPRERLLAALDPANFVARRTVSGGPARAALEPELDKAKSVQAQLQGWVDRANARIQASHDELMAWIV
jgi:argininosuccinate lyase